MCWSIIFLTVHAPKIWSFGAMATYVWLVDVADCLASESKYFWMRGSHPPGLLATANTDQMLATRFFTSHSYDLTLWSLIKRGTRLFLMLFTFCTFIDFLIANKRYIFLVKLSNTHCTVWTKWNVIKGWESELISSRPSVEENEENFYCFLVLLHWSYRWQWHFLCH